MRGNLGLPVHELRLHIHPFEGSGDGLCGSFHRPKEPITVTRAEIIYQRRIAVLDHAARNWQCRRGLSGFRHLSDPLLQWKGVADRYGLAALMPKERRALDKCVKCGVCYDVCNFGAVQVASGAPAADKADAAGMAGAARGASNMKIFNLSLDGKTVEAREGETILKCAKRLGVDVPALCYDPRLPPYTSCFICIVEVDGRRGVVPACATKCEPNMVVRTRTDNIVKLRRMALELLLSNHHGDCVAPCSLACPAGIDIRSYLSEVARGKYDRALRIIKERNPFPSVCGRICPHRCEDACRRHLVDDPVAINLVKRFVADMDRATGKPWRPKLAPRNGKRVAIIGGGPGGMSAAYYLVQLGYEPTVLEAMPKAGGMLRYGVPDYRLPQDVLDAEIPRSSSWA